MAALQRGPQRLRQGPPQPLRRTRRAHADAKGAKERLVAEAETLATSTDWAATAGAFKRLMDEWRRAGRASRSDDDKLWARFKAAQDSFFAAKDEVVAAEEEQYRGNLTVKEALLVEAEAILPVTDLEKAKGQLRVIQDKWDAAGKVPRSDMERVEKAMRRVEQTVRDAEDRRWKSSNPEVAARPAPWSTSSSVPSPTSGRPRQGRGVRQREQGQEGP